MKKKLIIIFVVIVAFFGIYAVLSDSESPVSSVSSNQELKVAACPTFYYMLEKLEEEGIIAIRTESSAENFQLLEEGKADIVISGRALKKGDIERFDYLLFDIIGPGYALHFKEEIMILEEEMQFVPFYSYIDNKKIIEDFSYISEQNLQEIERQEINKYMEKGVVITSLAKSFEIKGELVHVFKEDGSRLRLSRAPVLYYPPVFNKAGVELVQELIEEKE